MFRFNFKYELKLLLRSRWLHLLSFTLVVLFAFSAMNGKGKVAKRELDIATAKKEVAESDEMMLKLLDSVEKGMTVDVSPWTIPSNPMAVGNYHPRVASMNPQPLALMATGQADLFTHYVKPTVAGDDFALSFTEITSPVQLLFGSFDLAFVIIYLLPLLIIAFSYNILSSERESGSLRLLAAQPISLKKWVLQKLAIRFLWLSLIVLASLLIALLVAGVKMDVIVNFLPKVYGLVIGYMLFWFALVFLVNLWVGGSSKNAISLLGLWVLFVLLIPSMLNQLSSTLYPMPSRTLMINEMRSLKAEVSKKQDEILDNFLRDHPEYAINDTTLSRNFYHRYIASQKLVKQELEPLVATFEDQLQKRQHWLNRLKWLSPSIIVQESLNKMSGTTTADYEHFRSQVVTFAEEWRAHLIPFLYNNKKFSQKDYAALPKFEYRQKQHGSFGEIALLIVIGLGLCAIGFLFSYSSTSETVLNPS